MNDQNLLPPAEANQIARQDAPAPARVIAHTLDTEHGQLTFRGATMPELDRYLSNVKAKMVSSSVVLAQDMAHDKELAAQVFAQKPGLAVRVVNDEMAAKGFSTANQD